jgi:uncharacterized membrane protein YjgN (DUF898 family)
VQKLATYYTIIRSIKFGAYCAETRGVRFVLPLDHRHGEIRDKLTADARRSDLRDVAQATESVPIHMLNRFAKFLLVSTSLSPFLGAVAVNQIAPYMFINH